MQFQGGPGHGGQQQQGGHGGGGVSGQYSYSNWSPPAQSNESVNGYFLERSHSARQTLERACELLPDEEVRYRNNLLNYLPVTLKLGDT